MPKTGEAILKVDNENRALRHRLHCSQMEAESDFFLKCDLIMWTRSDLCVHTDFNKYDSSLDVAQIWFRLDLAASLNGALGWFSIPVLVPTHVLSELMIRHQQLPKYEFNPQVRVWPSRDQIPGCKLDPPDPPTLPSLLWTWVEQTFQTKFPTIPFTAAQHKHEKRLAAFIPTHPGAGGAADSSSSNTRLLVHRIPHNLFPLLLALFTSCIESHKFQINSFLFSV